MTDDVTTLWQGAGWSFARRAVGSCTGNVISRSALATDERRAMVRRDGVSVFESDIVIQSAKGIGGRRDRRRLQYRSRLTRLTCRRGFRYLYELPGFHVVDVAVYRNVIGHQWVVSDTQNILDDALGVIGKC